MSFPKFYVTYAVMDADAGANPFGHSFLLFSKQENEHSPVEVLDSIGYYSQPSTTTNPIIKKIKSILRLESDLQDGHGALRQEAIRYLNGNGLRGLSFPLTQEQVTRLQANYKGCMEKEQEAINELNAELTAQGIPATGYTRHIAEQEKAQREQRKPRLRPFHLTMQVTMHGFDSSASYTCKHRALEFLLEENIIDKALHAQLTDSNAKHAFPRYHAIDLPPIRLITLGEPGEAQRSKKGQVFHNHVWGKNQLHWATAILNQEDNRDYDELKSILNRITKMEKALYQIIDNPSDFTIEELHQIKIQLNRVQNLTFLFNKASLNQGPKLQEHLAKAEQVFNTATLAMEPQKINASFLLRAYSSIAAQSSLVGLLITALSVALWLITPPVGLVLGALSGVATGLSLYRFYKEEAEFAKMKSDYNEISSPTLIPF